MPPPRKPLYHALNAPPCDVLVTETTPNGRSGGAKRLASFVTRPGSFVTRLASFVTRSPGA